MLANKKLLSFFLLFGIAITSNAQQTKAGFIGGLNLATIGGDAEGIESRIGYHAGFFFNNKISSTFSIQPELVYSSQGGKAKNADLHLRYNYINFPIMVKYFATDNLYLQAGPQVGLLVSADVKFEDETEDIKDEVDFRDLSIGFGGGFEVENFIFSVRYNVGLSNTSNNSGPFTLPNRVVQISVAFPF